MTSIQRYSAYDDEGQGFYGDLIPYDGGGYVLYSDHIAAVEEAAHLASVSECNRIRQAVKKLTVDPGQGWYAQSVLDIIDGGDPE